MAVTLISPVGESPYTSLSAITFSWAPGQTQAKYEFAYKPVAYGDWISTGYVTSTNQFHEIPISSFTLNIRYIWRVRVIDSISEFNYNKSGWSDIQMFVLCKTGIGTYAVRTGSESTLLRIAVAEPTGIKVNYKGITGVMDVVADNAENVSRIRSTRGSIGTVWNLSPHGYVNINYINYADHSDSGHVNYYNYDNYSNYTDYDNYNYYHRDTGCYTDGYNIRYSDYGDSPDT